jgi:Chromo (CHRromatin Organisation MOdifier) domain
MMEQRKSTFVPYKLGDQVWLDTRNLKTTHHKKIGPKREGPFEIMKVIGPVTYQLKLSTTWRIHNAFHTTLLQQYKETEVYGANFPKPPPEGPELIGEEVYEVENILRHRKWGRKHEYYVKWKGYPISEASWEPEEVFSDDGDLLMHYKERHQL